VVGGPPEHSHRPVLDPRHGRALLEGFAFHVPARDDLDEAVVVADTSSRSQRLGRRGSAPEALVELLVQRLAKLHVEERAEDREQCGHRDGEGQREPDPKRQPPHVSARSR
jgi:hypothetical protein